MLIPKISRPKIYQVNSCKVSRRPILKHIQKIKKESSKESTEQIPPHHKRIEIQKIKVLYRPLNPQSKFHSSSIGINDIVKKDKASLITNDSIRDMILKFRQEREKEYHEKKLLYKDKSYQDIQKEKNTNFLMLRAMLRRDPLTIQSLMRKNRNTEKKMNKCNSMRMILKYKNISQSQKNYNRNKSSIFSGENLTSEKSNNNSNIINNYNNNNYNNSSINVNTNKSLVTKKNKFSKKEIWKKDFLLKIENIKKSFMKKYEAKITSAYSLILPGHIFAFKNNQNLKKKFNQDCSFSYMNLPSTKLDEISLFGIFDGNGPFGKGIALGFKNYIINYFKKCTEMRVTLKKDNFYSIMYNSFINAQNYLINNSTKLNINMKYSGATGIVVLYPHNNTNKIYCANVGRNKCIFYTMVGALRLSYELFPYRASERFRISLFKQQRKNKLQENDNSINIIDNNINKESTSNNMMVNNNMENLYTNNDTETRILNEREKENFLREFNELDISRCIGNLAAEELGVIPGPEIVESDIRLNKGKVLVMGTESLWKYLTEDEVGEIVNKHYSSSNSEAACKEIQDLAKERWKDKTGGYDDISVIVVFFDAKNL